MTSQNRKPRQRREAKGNERPSGLYGEIVPSAQMEDTRGQNYNWLAKRKGTKKDNAGTWRKPLN